MGSAGPSQQRPVYQDAAVGGGAGSQAHGGRSDHGRVGEDFHELYEVLQSIAEERAALGFAPSDVGRGLLIGCETVLPILQKAFSDDAQQLVWSVARIERIMHRSITMLDQAFKDTEAAREMAGLKAAAGAPCSARD